MNNYQLSVKKYPVYKDSAIAWLGDLPQHWEVKRLKDFSVIVRGGSPRPAGDLKFYEGNIPFLKVGDLTSNEELYLSTYTHTIKEAGLTNTRLISKNTLLLTNSGATLGIPKICTFETTFNDGIAAFTHLRNASQIFLFYFLKSQTKWYLNQASFGQGQPNLNIEIISNTFIPYPPISEQKSIANYLDTKTAQCDRKIDLLTQKATQYGKLKQSLINETVTRGLDKSVPMKDSGVEWIGEVPEHWQLKRLKDIGTSIIGITYAPEDALGDKNSGLLVLRSSNIQNGQLSLLDTVYVNTKVNPRQIVRKGDILICSRNGSRALIGKNICIDERTEGQTFGAFMTIYRSKYFRFISKFFNSNVFESQSGLFGSSTINQLTVNTLNNFLLILPPLSEQKAITDYLDKKTAQIDKIIQTINTQIEKLKELRKTLINDVVTGKIKVL
jgi:type I restriction enzyme S subunit